MKNKKLELENQEQIDELVDVSLEDILAEFDMDDSWTGEASPAAETAREAPAEEPAEQEPAAEAAAVEKPAEAAEPVTGDTIPLAKISDAVAAMAAREAEEAKAREEAAEAEQQAEKTPAAEQKVSGEEPVQKAPAENPVAPAAEEEKAPETTEDNAAQEKAEQAEPVTGDTVPLENIAQAVPPAEPVSGDTVPLENISDAVVPERQEASDDTVRLDDLSQVEASGNPVPGQRLEEEPRKEEPRREPIVFDPRARMRELKRKIIAGPEKRYYELSEKGVIKYQLGMLMCLLVIGASVGISLCFDTGVLSESRLKMTVFAQVMALLVGGLLGSGLMIDGIADVFHGKFTMNTWLAVTFLACCADSVFCLMEERIPVCAAFTLEVGMALWAAYHRRVTEMGQMDTLRKATRLNGLVFGEDFLDGRPAVLKNIGQVEDFMDHYQETSGPERAQNIYAGLSLALAVAVAALTAVLNGISMGVQILSTTLLVAVPASFFIAVTRPGAVLERRLHAMGTVLCGWRGTKALCRKCVYPLYDGDIFPSGAAKLNGVKFYGGRNPEQIIAFAAALMRVNGGGLEQIFEELLISRNGARYEVENVRFYGNGGIGGEICEEPVLMGSLEFLKDMGVEIPDGVMVKQAVYVSVDGDLCGLFAINYNRMKNATMGLVSLCANRRVKTVMMAEDFMLTGSFMKEKFGVNTRRMLFPSREERAELGARTPEEDAPVMALTTQAGLGPAAYAVGGAHALRKTCKMGAGIHILGGLLGVLIMLALCIQGSAHLLNPVRILLYQLVWTVPGLVITEGARTL